MDQHETESNTTADHEGINTPTTSGFSDQQAQLGRLLDTVSYSLGHPPRKGRTYMICDPRTHLVLGLKNGTLSLVPRSSTVSEAGYSGRDIHWYCDENYDRYFGFRNCASGTFMGCNKDGRLVATSQEHDDRQRCFFWARQCSATRGQILFVKRQSYWWVWHEPIMIDYDTLQMVADLGGEGSALEFDPVYIPS